jgi:ribosomal protein S18 acetylase RimI-like enzyme
MDGASDRISIRRLDPDEVHRFEEIDRTEDITHIWYVRDGEMVLEEEHWHMTGWPPDGLAGHHRHLGECMDSGGAAWGAFDGERLVGIAVLDGRWYGGARDTLDMYFLHVSDGYRHQGIGRTLTELAKERARELGAKRLFVSGLPSINTIRFYRAVGFERAGEVDPTLAEREPEDIHMELPL